MNSYVVRTPGQLAPIFSAFRKRSGVSQAQLSRLLGVSQQTVSQLERNPDKATLERLMRAFAAMDVEIVVRAKNTPAEAGKASPAVKASW